jgi:hypothetical protein
MHTAMHLRTFAQRPATAREDEYNIYIYIYIMCVCVCVCVFVYVTKIDLRHWK